MAAYSPVSGSDAPSPTEPLVATPRARPRATGAPTAAEATPPTTPNDVAQAAPQATPSKVYPPASPGGGGAPKRFLAFSTGPRQVWLSAYPTLPLSLPLPYPTLTLPMSGAALHFLFTPILQETPARTAALCS